jgi:hypothetical protein
MSSRKNSKKAQEHNEEDSASSEDEEYVKKTVIKKVQPKKSFKDSDEEEITSSKKSSKKSVKKSDDSEDEEEETPSSKKSVKKTGDDEEETPQPKKSPKKLIKKTEESDNEEETPQPKKSPKKLIKKTEESDNEEETASPKKLNKKSGGEKEKTKEEKESNEEELFDADIFDEEFKELTECAKNIIMKSESKKVMKSGINPVLKKLNNYKKAYAETDPIDHRDYFNTIYTKNRSRILKGPQNDMWLRGSGGGVFIQFGEGVLDSADIDPEIRLMLTLIYRNACTLRDELLDKVIDFDGASYPEYKYPDFFMLHLYRIFNQCLDKPEDRIKLISHINTLETNLDLELTSCKNGDQLASNESPTDSIMGMVNGILSGNENMPGMPSGMNLSKIISSVLGNPQTKNFINTTFNNLKDEKDLSGVFSKLGACLSDPSITEAFAGTLQGTAEASSSPPSTSSP